MIALNFFGYGVQLQVVWNTLSLWVTTFDCKVIAQVACWEATRLQHVAMDLSQSAPMNRTYISAIGDIAICQLYAFWLYCHIYIYIYIFILHQLCHYLWRDFCSVRFYLDFKCNQLIWISVHVVTRLCNHYCLCSGSAKSSDVSWAELITPG